MIAPHSSIPHPKHRAHPKVKVKAVGIRYGLISGVAMIAYFLIMRAAGLIEVTELRFVAYLILIVGIWLALREERRIIHAHRIPYLPGLGVGGLVTAITAILYGFFMVVYAVGLEPNFYNLVSDNMPFGKYVTPPMLGFAIFGETTILGVVTTFVLMQWFKRNSMETSQERFRSQPPAKS